MMGVLRLLFAALLAWPAPAGAEPSRADLRGRARPLGVGDCVVTLDAGGSRLRAKAFQLPRPAPTRDASGAAARDSPALPKLLVTADAAPGISSLGGAGGLYSHVLSLTREVASSLSSLTVEAAHGFGALDGHELKLPEVPIYLGVTADVRDLDDAARARLLQPIQAALRDGPFFFERESQVHVFSDDEDLTFSRLTADHGNGGTGVEPAGAMERESSEWTQGAAVYLAGIYPRGALLNSSAEHAEHKMWHRLHKVRKSLSKEAKKERKLVRHLEKLKREEMEHERTAERLKEALGRHLRGSGGLALALAALAGGCCLSAGFWLVLTVCLAAVRARPESAVGRSMHSPLLAA